ncbi:MAG: hypothetical protein BWX83_01144 [Candidatus Cloacimonetes bacterium ADurb.Bin117]|nr:MAG: hypothetical protein BWX83_01144 [Candidatus Cloacimonetes bacterium ADurb.Bin117]
MGVGNPDQPGLIGSDVGVDLGDGHRRRDYGVVGGGGGARIGHWSQLEHVVVEGYGSGEPGDAVQEVIVRGYHSGCVVYEHPGFIVLHVFLVAEVLLEGEDHFAGHHVNGSVTNGLVSQLGHVLHHLGENVGRGGHIAGVETAGKSNGFQGGIRIKRNGAGVLGGGFGWVAAVGGVADGGTGSG